MNKKDHHHQGDHRHHRKPPHKDWRMWTVVILMLAGMAIYIVSNEESLFRGGGTGEEVPEAAE